MHVFSSQHTEYNQINVACTYKTIMGILFVGFLTLFSNSLSRGACVYKLSKQLFKSESRARLARVLQSNHNFFLG